MKSLRNTLTTSIQRILASQGFELRRCGTQNGPSLSLLPLLIEQFMLSSGMGAVLQIGANDGVMEDPIRESILRLKLPALLVEPLPDLFSRLKTNYADQSQIYFENVAIGQSPGTVNLY